MIGELRNYFSTNLSPSDEDVSAEAGTDEIRRAAAALLLICAKADFEQHPDELRAIMDVLEQTFEIERREIDELMHLLDEETDVRKLQEFTSLVNQHYSLASKMLLIENLWRVAFADGRLDEFEEHYISRVAFLIRVSREQLLRCRETVGG